jgi:hypothetical protein
MTVGASEIEHGLLQHYQPISDKGRNAAGYDEIARLMAFEETRPTFWGDKAQSQPTAVRERPRVVEPAVGDVLNRHPHEIVLNQGGIRLGCELGGPTAH